MDTFVIDGGARLEGRITINGSKNAALPLMAAALLTDEPLVLQDVPDLADIRNMRRLLGELGCASQDQAVDAADAGPGGPSRALVLRTTDESASHARYDVVRTMRASICALGPMLARRGKARVSMPGGCAIGDRPVDLHLRGLAAMGASISLKGGDIVAEAPRNGDRARLHGARIFLGGPMGSTVLGTANVMSAAALADGTTVIESAACEPEIVDLANLLNAMGGCVSGAGSPRITVEGVERLRGAQHRVIPDRIEAGTYMCAAAITNGDLVLDNCPVDVLMAVTATLDGMGVRVTGAWPAPGLRRAGSAPLTGGSVNPMRASVRVTSERVLRPAEITTQPHPGFPTDLQAQFMALLCLVEGNSVVTEKIFPERFLHVAELARMGARVLRQGPTVIISGVKSLVGAPVMASDLRASASLVLAGLAAEGTTTINRVYHLDRGYERMEERLRTLGAQIERVGEREPVEAHAAAA